MTMRWLKAGEQAVNITARRKITEILNINTIVMHFVFVVVPTEFTASDL